MAAFKESDVTVLQCFLPSPFRLKKLKCWISEGGGEEQADLPASKEIPKAGGDENEHNLEKKEKPSTSVLIRVAVKPRAQSAS